MIPEQVNSVHVYCFNGGILLVYHRK